jgi:hypothetical protein
VGVPTPTEALMVTLPSPRFFRGFFVLTALCACKPEDGPKAPAGDSGAPDADGDGFGADQDCDDADPNTYPGAPERCDGKDNDCDVGADEDPIDPATWYADLDEDGFGDPTRTEVSCRAPNRYVDNALDCDDAEAEVNPEAIERCEAIDRDCDGLPGPVDTAATLRAVDGTVTNLTEADSPWLVGEAEALEICEGSWTAQILVIGNGRVAGRGLGLSRVDGVGAPIITFAPEALRVSITDLGLTDGFSTTYGGAIDGSGAPGLALDLVRVGLSDNASNSGGSAVYVQGTLQITDSVIEDNTTTRIEATSVDCRGGAVRVDGDLTILRSTFADNRVACQGGSHSAAHHGDGGAASVTGTVVATESTFTGNTVQISGDGTSAWGGGGAIWANALELHTVTATDNLVAVDLVCNPGVDTCPVSGLGGAFFAVEALSFTDTILTANEARATGGAPRSDAHGGGVYATAADPHFLCDRLMPCGITGNIADSGLDLYWLPAAGRLRSDDHDWGSGSESPWSIDGATTRSPGPASSFTCTAGVGCTEG